MKNIKENLLFSFCYQALATLFPLITTPYISRVLGAEGIGIYSYSSSIALYFIYFGMLGVSDYGNRCIAQIRDNQEQLNKTFSSIYYLQLITGSISVLLYIFYSLNLSQYRLVSLIQIIYVIRTVFDISWLFFGLEEFKLTATRQMIIRVINLISILVFVNDENDLWIYTLIMTICNFSNCVVLWFFLKGRVKFVFVTITDCFKHFKSDLKLFIPVLSLSVFGVLDKIMIGALVSVEETGYYECADKIVLICSAIFSAFSSVLMPRVSNLLAIGNREKALKYFYISLEIIMCIAIALSSGFIAVAKEFIPLFYGKGYEKSIILLIGLSIGIPFTGWAYVYRVLYLIPAEKDSIYVNSTIFGAILNTIFNFILITAVGTIGAVIATVLSQAIIAFYQSYKVRMDIKPIKIFKSIALFLLLGIIMIVTIRFVASKLKPTWMTLIIEIGLGVFIYGVGAFLILLLGKNDIVTSIVKKIFCF